jgi:hypothetical protein
MGSNFKWVNQDGLHLVKDEAGNIMACAMESVDSDEFSWWLRLPDFVEDDAIDWDDEDELTVGEGFQQRAGIVSEGYAPTLEEAKAAAEKNWPSPKLMEKLNKVIDMAKKLAAKRDAAPDN